MHESVNLISDSLDMHKFINGGNQPQYLSLSYISDIVQFLVSGH